MRHRDAGGQQKGVGDTDELFQTSVVKHNGREHNMKRAASSKVFKIIFLAHFSPQKCMQSKSRNKIAKERKKYLKKETTSSLAFTLAWMSAA